MIMLPIFCSEFYVLLENAAPRPIPSKSFDCHLIGEATYIINPVMLIRDHK